MKNANLDYRMPGNSQKGFSLIEVMVVVVIIGIIASIALPSYREHIIKTRREAGKACLMQAAQQMERFYTANMRYDGAGSPVAFVCETDVSDHYVIAPAVAADVRTYTLSATPVGNDPQCGVLTISQDGARTPETAGCW